MATVMVLEFASQAVCWRSCASVGIGGGFGICFTDCLLEELRVCWHRWWFWNLLHGLFVVGVAPSVGIGGGFGVCFTGCLLEERLRNEVGF